MKGPLAELSFGNKEPFLGVLEGIQGGPRCIDAIAGTPPLSMLEFVAELKQTSILCNFGLSIMWLDVLICVVQAVSSINLCENPIIAITIASFKSTFDNYMGGFPMLRSTTCKELATLPLE